MGILRPAVTAASTEDKTPVIPRTRGDIWWNKPQNNFPFPCAVTHSEHRVAIRAFQSEGKANFGICTDKVEIRKSRRAHPESSDFVPRHAEEMQSRFAAAYGSQIRKCPIGFIGELNTPDAYDAV